MDFIIMVDSSTFGIAAILCQVNGNYTDVLGFAGRSLRPCETRYTVTEMEMLANVHAVKEWKSLLLEHKIVIYSVHLT